MYFFYLSHITKISIALLYYYRVNETFFLGDFRRKLNFSPNFRRFLEILGVLATLLRYLLLTNSNCMLPIILRLINVYILYPSMLYTLFLYGLTNFIISYHMLTNKQYYHPLSVCNISSYHNWVRYIIILYS